MSNEFVIANLLILGLNLIVYPGDWIVEHSSGFIQVMSAEQFNFEYRLQGSDQ